MNYHQITHDDMLNGDGLRVVLWAAGCEHHCFNCQNSITWDPEDGLPFTAGTMIEIREWLDKDYTSGITYSGGDPLHPDNIDIITTIANLIKNFYPDKTQWLYTGYSWEEVKDLEVIDYLDVLVDGEYMEELRDTKLHWVGSSNQRVIDVKKSKATGTVVLHESADTAEYKTEPCGCGE